MLIIASGHDQSFDLLANFYCHISDVSLLICT